MSIGLQECKATPQGRTSSAEPLNATNLKKHDVSKEHYVSNNSKPDIPVRSGNYISCKRNGSVSPNKHIIFVLDINGEPLTPCKPSKARKFLRDKKAKPQWNKFGKFGIQMLVETRKEKPKTVLSYDGGTIFEGYTITADKLNNFGVMWKLPDKKKLVRKLKERKILRRARRFRNCRRRKCRFQNRKETFIAPSQKMMVDSRSKCMKELIRCYPVDTATIEDVRFNHRDNKWGKNFTTMEIGKTLIDNFFKKHKIKIHKYRGYETKMFREKYGYHKNSNKSKIDFNTHCSDALAITAGLLGHYIEPTDNFVYVDDSYKPVRRKLHDTQPAKGGIRKKYSNGNFQDIRKGTMCEYGQIVGGTKNMIWYRDWSNKPQKGKVLSKIQWYSKQFKTLHAQ